jgi:threonine dehydrogenase-like Zn-dependent dehydrogenase
VPVIKEFTEGYGLDAAVIAFGGDGTEAFNQLLKMMKMTPDTHQMGCVVIVGGCMVSTRYASATGNLDVRSSARTGPGYHDEAWERGRDYPPVFVEWNTRRNVELCLRLISEGQLNVKALTTHRVPLSKAPEACEELIQRPDRALGVVILPKK